MDVYSCKPITRYYWKAELPSPPVICNNILALVVDGTNQCAFLLDDTKRELEAVKSLQGISSYISSNINKLPHIKSLDNPNRLTVTNGSDRKAEFVYDNEIDCYCVDLRHIKRKYFQSS